MTKYDYMVEAACTAEKNFNDLQLRSVQLLAAFVTGLATYCDMPLNKITFLRWNRLTDDARQYLDIPDGSPNVLPAAVEFDKTDGFWHVGIVINLSPPNRVFPELWASAVICASEQQGKPVLKIGWREKPQNFNPADSAECQLLYKSVFNKVVGLFSADHSRVDSKAIGFVVSR